MQVHDLLLQAEKRNPSAKLVWENGNWSEYTDILNRAKKIAAYIHNELEIPKGSRVSLYWENSADAIAASFGIWLAGCVLVSLNIELKGTDLAFQIKHSDSLLIISGGKQLRHIHAIAAELETVKGVISAGPLPPENVRPLPYHEWGRIINEGEAIREPVRTISIDLASIVYTSGSTGTPKGVMLSHLNLVSNMHSIAEYLGLTSEDRIMMILPHFYIYGLSLVLTHILVGGSIVIDNRFMYPNTVLQTMIDTEATGFSGVPSTYSILLGRSTVHEMAFPSLRYVTQAGGGMPPAVQKEVVKAFAPAKLFIMYGATEAAPRLSYLDPDMLEKKWGSIGKPVPNVDLFVADEKGKELPIGTEGEIVARGSNITSGYWKDPEGSAQVLRNGLYFTGDLGKVDDDGFLFVTGRAKNILKVKGFRVSPKEIEEHIAQYDGIADSAVIGVTDEILGEAPVAYLEKTDGKEVEIDGLKKFLQGSLPSYKVPVEYIFIESLPKSAAGKVDKKALKEHYEGGKK